MTDKILGAETFNIKAAQGLNLEGGQVKIKGNTTTVEAKGILDIKSSGVTNVKGSIVKLN
jgi:hypothetical protein